MVIRDAQPADADAIADVARAAWHAAYADLLGGGTVDATVDEWYDPGALREELARAVESDDRVFLVATDAGDVVGFANAGPAQRDEAPADAFFSRLYVHPDHWGSGIGTDLTATVFDRLRRVGFESVWLEVFEANDVGRTFYESVGFERVGRVDETFDGTTLATLHLRAPLSMGIDRDRN